MDEFKERANELLDQRIGQVREQYKNMSRAEKEAEMEHMNKIIFSLSEEDRVWLDQHLTDEIIRSYDECEALYLAGLKDGLRLLKLISI